MHCEAKQRQAQESLLSVLGYWLPAAKQELHVGWWGPSLEEETKQDCLPRAILGRLTEYLSLLEKGCL